MSESKSPNGWTLDTLEAHLSLKILALHDRVNERFESMKELSNEREIRNQERVEATKISVDEAKQSSEKAVAKAELASEKRQDAANEIRAAMIDQQRHFADKEQTDFRLKALEERLAVAGGRSQGIGIVVGVIFAVVSSVGAVVGAIVTALVRH